MELDEKIREWRCYQQSKRAREIKKMVQIKTFPCFLLIENAHVAAFLKLITNICDKYVDIVSKARVKGVGPKYQFHIPLASIRRYNKDQSTITITTKNIEDEIFEGDVEELVEEEDQIQIHFPTIDTLEAAFAEIEDFLSGRTNDTSPSSESD